MRAAAVEPWLVWPLVLGGLAVRGLALFLLA